MRREDGFPLIVQNMIYNDNPFCHSALDAESRIYGKDGFPTDTFRNDREEKGMMEREKRDLNERKLKSCESN